MNTQFNSRNADTLAIGATNRQLYTEAQAKIADYLNRPRNLQVAINMLLNALTPDEQAAIAAVIGRSQK